MLRSPFEEERKIGILWYSTKTPGVGGIIKERPEDFVVKEDAVVEGDEKGEHVCLLVKKRGMSTDELLEEIARQLRIEKKLIGYAGKKDRNAVAFQYISIPLRFYKRIEGEGFEVLEEKRVRRKIRPGHLRGNWFEIKVRKIEDGRKIEQILEQLEQRGCPNYYGPQRFGINLLNHVLGKLLLKKRYEEFLELLKKSKLYERFFKREGKIEKLMRILPRADLRFFIEAYQSYLFNLMLSKRMERGFYPKEKVEGEFVKGGGKPALPLIGYKSKIPSGESGEIVREVLEEEGVSRDEFKHETKWLREKGGLREVELEFKSFNYRLLHSSASFSFWLKKGCYATILLREFCKVRLMQLISADPPRMRHTLPNLRSN